MPVDTHTCTTHNVDNIEQQLRWLKAYCEVGDRAALESLLAVHFDAAYRMAFMYFGNEHDAADSVQEACLNIMRYAHSYKQGSSLKSWIMSIVMNACHNTSRREKRVRNKMNSYAQGLHTMNMDNKNSMNVDNVDNNNNDTNELQDIVTQLTLDLPDLYRMPLTLHYIEGHSVQETAKILGKSQSAIRKQLQRGVSTLRDALPAYGYKTSSTAMLLLSIQQIILPAAPTQASIILPGLIAGGPHIISASTLNILHFLKATFSLKVLAPLLFINAVATLTVMFAEDNDDTNEKVLITAENENPREPLQLNDIRLDLDVSDGSLINICMHITELSGIEMDLSHLRLESRRDLFGINMTDFTLREILDYLSHLADIRFTTEGDKILLYEKSAAHIPLQKSHTEEYIHQTQGEWDENPGKLHIKKMTMMEIFDLYAEQVYGGRIKNRNLVESIIGDRKGRMTFTFLNEEPGWRRSLRSQSASFDGLRDLFNMTKNVRHYMGLHTKIPKTQTEMSLSAFAHHLSQTSGVEIDMKFSWPGKILLDIPDGHSMRILDILDNLKKHFSLVQSRTVDGKLRFMPSLNFDTFTDRDTLQTFVSQDGQSRYSADSEYAKLIIRPSPFELSVDIDAHTYQDFIEQVKEQTGIVVELNGGGLIVDDDNNVDLTQEFIFKVKNYTLENVITLISGFPDTGAQRTNGAELAEHIKDLIKRSSVPLTKIRQHGGLPDQYLHAVQERETVPSLTLNTEQQRKIVVVLKLNNQQAQKIHRLTKTKGMSLILTVAVSEKEITSDN